MMKMLRIHLIPWIRNLLKQLVKLQIKLAKESYVTIEKFLPVIL